MHQNTKLHLGPIVHSWFGGAKMRLKDDARKCIVFFGVRTMNTSGQSVPKFGGTGFCVSVEFAPNRAGAYLVTARHVAEDLAGPFVVGFNNKGGGIELRDVDEANWQYHQDENVDIAVMFMFAFGDADLMPLPHIAIAEHEDPEWSQRFGVGDLVYVVGLYRLFPGKSKITPAVHTGHIAMMPDEEVPVINRTTSKIFRFKGFLIEAQTLDGLSGAPVFVRPVMTVVGGSKPFVAYADEFRLIGVWSSSWDGPSGETLSAHLGGQTKVPVGMGVVTPAKYLLEILNSDIFFKDRQISLEKYLNENPAITDY